MELTPEQIIKHFITIGKFSFEPLPLDLNQQNELLGMIREYGEQQRLKGIAEAVEEHRNCYGAADVMKDISQNYRENHE